MQDNVAIQKKKMHKDRKNRPQIVLVFRSIIVKDDKILLLQRSEKDPFMPGKWEFPGGKLEKDQEITVSFYREILEETNLLVKMKSSLVYYSSETLKAGKYRDFPLLVLIGIAEYKSGETKISDEHTSFEWCTPKEALSKNIKPKSKKALKAFIKSGDL